jgi:hypothetical protein
MEPMDPGKAEPPSVAGPAATGPSRTSGGMPCSPTLGLGLSYGRARLHDLGRARRRKRARAARGAPCAVVELQADGAGGHVERALVHVLVAGHGRVARKPARARPARSAVRCMRSLPRHTTVVAAVEPVILGPTSCTLPVRPGLHSAVVRVAGTAYCAGMVQQRAHHWLRLSASLRGLASGARRAPASVRVGSGCLLSSGWLGWSGQRGSGAGGHHSVSDSTTACCASPRRLRDGVAGEDGGGPPGATLPRGAARWSAAAGRASAPARARAWLAGTQTLPACASGRAALAAMHGNPLALALRGAAGRRGRSQNRRLRMPGALRAGGRARAVRPSRREAHAAALQAVRAALKHFLGRHARLRAHRLGIPAYPHGSLGALELRCRIVGPRSRSGTEPLRLWM